MTISGGPFLLREGEVGREESLRFPSGISGFLATAFQTLCLLLG